MTIRRPSPALAVSAALHVALGLALARVLMDAGSLDWALPDRRAEPPKQERVRYVAVAPPARTRSPAGLATPGRAGGDGQRARADARRSAPPLAAPGRVPTGVPTAPASGASDGDEAGGTGPLVGGGGPLRGVQPRYGDGRVWRPPAAVPPEPRTHEERLDSAFAVRFKAHQDSMAALAGVRKAGDWTVTRADGTKWGIEPAGSGGGVQLPTLHLGRLKIPLPVGLPVRPGQLERERALRTITSDLAQQSTRRLTEDEFRKAVRDIRERKEWERSRQTLAQQKGGAPESAP